MSRTALFLKNNEFLLGIIYFYFLFFFLLLSQFNYGLEYVKSTLIQAINNFADY